jgi:predicted nucleic acid-binding protein
VTFLKSFGGNGFHVAELEDEDLPRMAELVERYVDLPLGLVDAAVIAIAERLGLKEVATVDQRHFRVVRSRHVEAFTLLPG